MLKYLLLAILPISALAAGPAHGVMTGTAHALGKDPCKFCHTPYSQTPGTAPLWARSAPEEIQFKVYSTSIAGAAAYGQPRGVSLVCLSCHDGATSRDAAYHTAGGWPDTGASFASRTGLTGGHPISTTYAAGRNYVLRPIINGAVGKLPLFPAQDTGSVNNQVECASCHNPHDMTYGKYLRMSTARSALCLTCHIK